MNRFWSLFLPLFCLALEASGGTNAPVPVRVPGGAIDNFYQLSRRIYSGAAPEGDAAFTALARLGIKTIISVDGAKPDVDAARRFGIRYAHLPFGYDGVPTNQAVRLVKAAETLPGPVFVHCHHGQHRGPAGAAVICMGTEGWTAAEAEAWLRQAGTATNYAGLYRTVAQFQPPTPGQLKQVSAEFPEVAPVPPLAEAMVQVDERFDHLKLLRKAAYRPLANHPELEPAREALLLEELFKELRRSPAASPRGPDFQNRLQSAATAATALRAALGESPLNAKKAEAAFQRLDEDCRACHKAHRN